MQMDDAVHVDWEKELSKYGLSGSQLGQSCGDCSLTPFSGNIADTHESDELPGPYVPPMYLRIMSAEMLHVVSPERAAEIMKLCPPDDIGRPYFQKSLTVVDERTVKYGPSRMEPRVQYGHKADKQIGGIGWLLDRASQAGRGTAGRKLVPDKLESQTWGRSGRTCSELHPSDADWFWFRYALDDRWIPPMHEIVSIASAGSDEREWQEKQINHSRGDRTGLGRSIDKVKYPSWARRPETLAFALHEKFPGMKPGRRPPQDFNSLANAIEVIWKRTETSLSERERASLRKQLERFRQHGLQLSKDAQNMLVGLEELITGNLDDSLGDPVKIGLVFLWQQAGFLSLEDLNEFVKERNAIDKAFSDLVELGRDISKRIKALETVNSYSFDYIVQLQTDIKSWEHGIQERKNYHNYLLYETLNKAKRKASTLEGKSQTSKAIHVLQAISSIYNS
jgi:hypothetical protein